MIKELPLSFHIPPLDMELLLPKFKFGGAIWNDGATLNVDLASFINNTAKSTVSQAVCSTWQHQRIASALFHILPRDMELFLNLNHC